MEWFFGGKTVCRLQQLQNLAGRCGVCEVVPEYRAAPGDRDDPDDVDGAVVRGGDDAGERQGEGHLSGYLLYS
ncbi:hypothetical protein D3C81_1697570 [compost metagenome]